jgi:hypothetical protein
MRISSFFRWVPLFVACATSLSVFAQDNVIISEFLASNNRGLRDENGEFSDWIEIYNAGTNTVNLLDWGLTDDVTSPFRWRFPATNITAGRFMIVFASNKDRRTPGAPLHTNFRLDAGGEYLGLFRPDGTVATEFNQINGGFPPQMPNISYGRGVVGTNLTVIFTNSPARVLIPTAATPANWMASDFDDSSWMAATNGVGFGPGTAPFLKTDVGPIMSNINASAYIRLAFSVDNVTNVALFTLRMRYDDGFVAYLNGVEVLRANAPSLLAYNSAATNTHAATNIDEFRLGPGYLVSGTNILAIQGLNRTVSDNDFLIAAEALTTSVAAESENPLYFTTPTPGTNNVAGVAVLGPAILDPHHSPALPTDADDIVVSAEIVPTFQPLATVVLRYRVMFNAEVEVPMFDDGLHGDGGSNDMVFAATIPASASTNGQMVRWYIRATDSVGTTSRWPLFTANTETEYLGTMVSDPSVVSKLPVVYLFAQPAVLQPGPTTTNAAADSQNGSRGVSVFHDGEFYDNIMVAVRGNTTASYNKKSHRFEFNADHAFHHSGPGPRLLRTSFEADYPDPAYMRQGLCYWLGDLIGCPSPFYIPHRLQLNGQFYQLASHNDVSGREMLDRLGYNSQGALYNAAGVVVPGRFSTGGFEKKTREWDTTDADYTQLANGIAEALSPAQRRTNVFDFFDIPQVINYLVTARWGHENDDVWANMSLYHDNDGDNLWRIIPFDMNLSWGAIYYEGGNLQVIEGVQATNDIHKAFPLYGSSAATALSGPGAPNNYNRVYDSFFLIQQTREMFLRRMRTMMDKYVFPIGTAPGASPIEQKILAWRDLVAEEANRDRARWGWPAKGGQCNFDPGITFTNGVNQMLTNFVLARRQHFYGKHSVTNTALPIGITKDLNAGIPTDQPGDALVLISGIEYNPTSGNQDQEYICITNPQPYAIDLSDWQLSGGIDFKFKQGTVIPSTSVLYVSPNVVAFRARTLSPKGGQGHFIVGPYQGQLSARGETVLLHDNTGRLVHTNSYPGTPSAAQQFLRVTEIMYSPAPPTSGPYGKEDFEYIELRNIGTSLLSLAGVRFVDGIIFNFTGSAAPSLGAGQRVLLVRNTNAFTARYGSGLNIAGQYSGALDNGGERLRLVDVMGEEILDFSYNNSWYPITDGHGFSLVIRDDTAPFYTWGDKASWRPSGQLNGSPGLSEPAPPVIAPIRINEVLAHTDLPQVDSVELYNPTTNVVDISGWFISDDLTNVTKFRIPNGTTIAAGGYVSFNESQFNPTPGVPPSFAFSSKGDEAVLVSADLAGNLTGYLDVQDFGASESGVPFGPYFTSTGKEHFVALQALTPNATNSGPKIGPIIISEIMYHPPDVGGEDDSIDEFIELKNISGSTVNLYNTTNTWRLDKGVDFDFPPGVTLPAGGHLLVVNFDPTNATQVAAFRSRYGVSPSVPLYGPYEGKLDNGGERVELQKPDNPDTNGVSYIVVERVDYEDSAPWPGAADGGGASLHRRTDTSYYNDPANWVAALPGAGSDYPGGSAPVITTQPSNQSVVGGRDATLTVAATGAGLSYQWRRNGDIIAGATSSTLTLLNVRPNQQGSYDVVIVNSAGSVVSSNAFVRVLTPLFIGANPISLVFRGSNDIANFGKTFSNATFTVAVASGNPPVNYQWYYQGAAIPLATGPTLVVSNVTIANEGSYYAVISDAISGGTSTVATITVLVTPVITEQPGGATVAVGDSVTMRTSIRGNPPPFGYRWRRSGGNVTNAIVSQTTHSLTLNNMRTNDFGTYTVIVTNTASAGTAGILSSNAYVTVVVPPTNQVSNVGSDATFVAPTFAATVSGGFPRIAYQWRFNGIPIANATNNVLTVTNVQTANDGSYSLTVSVTGWPNTPPIVPATFGADLTVIGSPLTISSPQLLGNGTFRGFVRAGGGNKSYTVEVSTNLANWATLTTVNYTNGPTPFTDPGATNSRQRFYRAHE